MTATAAIAMTLDLLVCPACRRFTADRIDVRTLEHAGDLLVCECGRRYPVVDGVPIVLTDPSSVELTGVLERELSPSVVGLLVEPGPDDAPYPRLVEHLSIYLDAHWGDRAEPPPDGPGAGFALAPLVERIAALPRVGLAVELGCSVGRIVAELPAERVVGVDLQFGAARRARRLLAGESLPYARRAIGRTYTSATAAGRTRDATIVCSDVLDPPLVPQAFDRVVALNMLDSVAHPLQLLTVIDGLCAAGGEVVLSSPYAWQSHVMHDHERIGGRDPAAAVAGILREGQGLSRPYQIVEEAEVSWILRRDARSAVTYQTHYLRARKGT